MLLNNSSNYYLHTVYKCWTSKHVLKNKELTPLYSQYFSNLSHYKWPLLSRYITPTTLTFLFNADSRREYLVSKCSQKMRNECKRQTWTYTSGEIWSGSSASSNFVRSFSPVIATSLILHTILTLNNRNAWQSLVWLARSYAVGATWRTWLNDQASCTLNFSTEDVSNDCPVHIQQQPKKSAKVAISNSYLYHTYQQQMRNERSQSGWCTTQLTVGRVATRAAYQYQLW